VLTTATGSVGDMQDQCDDDSGHDDPGNRQERDAREGPPELASVEPERGLEHEAREEDRDE